MSAIHGRSLYVYGAGGHGKVVADVGRSAGALPAGFIDDDPARRGTRVFGVPLAGWQDFLRQYDVDDGVVVALGIGDNDARARVADRIAASGWEPVTLVHAAATVAPSARLGIGTVVMAGAVVNPDATVGAGCIVNTGAVVEHDNRIGEFTLIGPNAALAGGVEVGTHVLLGIGAVVLPGVRIGDRARVGAGAVVVRDVPAGATVVGVPARRIDAR
jgi:sugar O-acyltransferase (sialic acid O-acetyltransferase NeuD family)